MTYLAGRLYLGVFSGPIEGILMIVAIFVVTGFHGTVVDVGVVSGVILTPSDANRTFILGSGDSHSYRPEQG